MPPVGGRLGGPNVANLVCVGHLAGKQRSHFQPRYTTAAECMQQYKGPYVSCFAYDPNLSTWTAFFKLPEGGFRTVGKISSEDECKRYIGAFKDGIPTACRQLAMPVTCNVACVAPVPAPPPAAKPVEPDPTPAPPDPASIETKPSDIQVGGKQYTKVAGLTWVERESTKPDSSQLRPSAFADVSVGPTELQSKDKPTPCLLRCRLPKLHTGGMYQSSMRSIPSHLRRSSTW